MLGIRRLVGMGRMGGMMRASGVPSHAGGGIGAAQVLTNKGVRVPS